MRSANEEPLLPEAVKNEEQKENKVWVSYTILATVLFTICNSAFSEISLLGIEGLLYMSVGPLLCGLTYYTYQAVTGGKGLMHDFRKEGSIDWRNVGGFLLFASLYICIQSLVIVLFGLCREAGLNAGIVTSIWAINPLFGALFDRLLFGQTLSTKHIVGVLCLMACAAFISLSGVVYADDTTSIEVTQSTVPSWVPVVLAMVCPIFFTSTGVVMKYMTAPKRGFNPWGLSFGSYALVGSILTGILIIRSIAIPGSFQTHTLIIGTFGSIVNTLGIVLINKASTLGPLGPVQALACIQSIMFTSVQAVLLLAIPTLMEFAGIFIGININYQPKSMIHFICSEIMGALVLTIPKQLQRLFGKVFPCIRPKEDGFIKF